MAEVNARFYWMHIDGKDILPEPWVYDGVRRMYSFYRKPEKVSHETTGWVARAINPTSRTISDPHESFEWRMPLVQAFGSTPGEAVQKLLDHFFPPDPEVH